jgi:hypothetical protein
MIFCLGRIRLVGRDPEIQYAPSTPAWDETSTVPTTYLHTYMHPTAWLSQYRRKTGMSQLETRGFACRPERRMDGLSTWSQSIHLCRPCRTYLSTDVSLPTTGRPHPTFSPWGLNCLPPFFPPFFPPGQPRQRQYPPNPSSPTTWL